MDGKQCTFIKSDGSQCEAYSVSNSELCFVHEPSLKEKRDLARTYGGRVPVHIVGIPTDVATAKDVLALIAETIGNLRAMPTTVGQARAIIISCVAALQCLELTSFEERLIELEEYHNEK